MEVFDDWYAAGPIADDSWQEYESAKSLSYPEALKSYAAKHVYSFDKFHLDRVDGGILALPAGKSGHLELGYLAGCQKPTFVLLDKEPERWDVMYQFATGGVFFNIKGLIARLQQYENLSGRANEGDKRQQLPGVSPLRIGAKDQRERSIQSGREGGGGAWVGAVQSEKCIQPRLTGDMRVGGYNSNDARMASINGSYNREAGRVVSGTERALLDRCSSDMGKESINEAL